jgi:hypothetical protein
MLYGFSVFLTLCETKYLRVITTMTDSPSSTVQVPLLLVQDDLVLSGEKRARKVFIVESSLPWDLKEAVPWNR